MENLMQWEYFWLALLSAAFITGLVDGLGGSGGLIITPFLIAVGMPPQLAIGTAKLGSLSTWTLAARNFHKNKMIDMDILPILVGISIVSAILGASTAVTMDPQTLFFVIGILLVLVSPLSLLIKDFGLEKKLYSQKRRSLGYGLYILAMIYAAFFGGGSGVFLILALVGFLGMTSLQAHATNMIPILVMSIVSVVIFGLYDHIHYGYAALIFTGSGLGALIGSHLAIKGGSKIVRHIVGVFAFVIGSKFIFDYLSV